MRPSQQGRLKEALRLQGCLKEALRLQGWTIVHPESRTKIFMHIGNMCEVEDTVSRRVAAAGPVNGFAG